MASNNEPPPDAAPAPLPMESEPSAHGVIGITPLDPSRESRPWLRIILRADALLARVDAVTLWVALGLSALLPTLSVLLTEAGIAASAWYQLLPRFSLLAIAFVGASLAARQGGHIALDLLTRVLPSHITRWTRFAADGVAAMVCALLAWGAWELVVIEREGGTLIQQTIPSWVPVVILVWGFALCSLRFLLHAARTFVPALLIAPLLLVALATLGDTATFWLATIGLSVGILLGTPLFVVLGGASVLLFWNSGMDLAAVHADTYGLSGKDALIALPLFTLMGAVLAKGEAPLRLVRVARACLGWFPGGLAITAVIVSAFFTTFTGASGVTILALGLLLHRMLIEEGYNDRLSIGLVTSSGAIGLLFAPALPLMVYGIVAKVDIRSMFKAGVVPGWILVAFVAGTAVFLARRGNLRRHPFVVNEALAAIKAGIWDLLLPLLVLGLYLSGLAGVVQSAAIGVVYTVIIATLVHKDVHWRRDLPNVARDSAVLIGAVLIILAVAYGLTGFLVEEEVPQLAINWARENISSKWVFLLGLNGLLLVVGCLLDIFSAIIIFVPLVMPIAAAFGIHPVHLGIIFLANLEIGYLTPPVGMNLFLASFRFKREMPEIWRTVIPFLLVLVVALMIITYVPALSLWLIPDTPVAVPLGLP